MSTPTRPQRSWTRTLCPADRLLRPRGPSERWNVYGELKDQLRLVPCTFVDIDAHWRPADVEHRHGRIVRHGNPDPDVRSTQVVANESYDSFCMAKGGAPIPLHQPDYEGGRLGYTPIGRQGSGRESCRARVAYLVS